MRSEDATEEVGSAGDPVDPRGTIHQSRRHHSLNTLRLRADSPERSTSLLAQVVSFLLCQIPLALSHVKDIAISILVAIARALKLQV